ncbi:MAG TPA: iron-sulfur cluster assembly protein [Ignavibacteriaceae bacterium]|nr:iron-sulfur cluster assembly protein [Ignavibacteriaceae bacterium]
MNLNENHVLEALKTVIDPEIGINIVDLGLVYRIEIKEDRITIDMTLTTKGCPMHNSMPGWVKECLVHLAPSAEVVVNLVWSPAWTPKLMSEAAKEQLGF